MRLVTRGALALLLGATLAAILACGSNSNNGGISPACGVVATVQPLDDDNTDQNTSLPVETIERFERLIDRLMRDLKTPGLSAVILKDQQIVWDKGFGFADVEARLQATPDTVYGLASVTKALASVVFFRSLESGCVSLDDPASMYNAFADSYENAEEIKLRHLMSHTSLDPVGTVFEYDGNRYGGIGNAIKRAFGVSFKEQFQRDIAGPLGMTRTAANPNDPEVKDRFASFLRARGHKFVIRNDKGRSYKLIDGFDYTNRRWGQSYLLLESMIDNALSTTSYGKGLFENRHHMSVDEETQLLFTSFFLNQPEVAVYRQLAKPYHYDEQVNIARTDYPGFFNPGAGMNSTVRDLAQFDIALDQGLLISDESKNIAWEPVRSPTGEPFPYGYGWFTQEYAGKKIVWHGGAWRGMSAMYLKVPEDNLTFIMLSNSKVQSDAFDVGRGDALKSAFGLSFLRLFVYEPMYTTVAPVIDWLSPAETLVAQIEGIQDERLREMTLMELEVMQGLYMFMQNTDAVERLMNGVRMHFMEPYTDPYAEREVIAQLEGIANGQRLSTAFTLDNETAVRVYGIGEISPQGAFDYGWIVEENTGDTVWSMEQGEWDHAGGAPRNRLADVVVRLPAGSYSLHYVSDDSHSYMSWNSTPPDHLYWGIRLLEEK